MGAVGAVEQFRRVSTDLPPTWRAGRSLSPVSHRLSGAGSLDEPRRLIEPAQQEGVLPRTGVFQTG